MTLLSRDEIFTDDEIITLRDKVFRIFQDRALNINQRLANALTMCDTSFIPRDFYVYCDLLMSLEQLDASWGKLIQSVKQNYSRLDFDAFDKVMQDRAYEYEQFIVYLLYRHFANSPDFEQAQSVMRFIAFSYTLVRNIGANLLYTNDKFTIDDQIEICRLFSCELEYSDENLYTLFDML